MAGVIDTSAIFDVRTRWYAHDVFHSVSAAIETSAEAGRICTVSEVLNELKRQHQENGENLPPDASDRLNWATSTFPIARDIMSDSAYAEFLQTAVEIAASHQRWSQGVRLIEDENDSGRPFALSAADPYVIALAEVTGSAVVSSETNNFMMDPHGDVRPIDTKKQLRNNAGLFSSQVRIPDMCLIRGVTHYSLLEFFRSQRWKF